VANGAPPKRLKSGAGPDPGRREFDDLDLAIQRETSHRVKHLAVFFD
jgi:hypothetical protein